MYIQKFKEMHLNGVCKIVDNLFRPQYIMNMKLEQHDI